VALGLAADRHPRAGNRREPISTEDGELREASIESAALERSGGLTGRLTFEGFGGVPLVADAYGLPEDPPILLLPAAGRTSKSWRRVAEGLVAAGYYAISLDYRGHGDSGRAPDGRYGFDVLRRDVEAVLTQLPARPIVIGGSLGALCAIGALAGHEALASGLVLVDIDAASTLTHDRLTENPPWGSGSPTYLYTEALAEVRAPTSALTLPTLVIQRGSRRMFGPEEKEGLLGLAPAAEFVDLETVDTETASEPFETFNAVLLEFLERRAPRSPITFEEGSAARVLRDALGSFATGVIVATTFAPDGAPIGLTANSFTSVSLDPPLVLFCLARTAGSLAAFENADSFAANVLHIGQQPVSARFAKPGEDRFGQTDWEQWDGGPPIIRNSLASIDCEKHAIHDGGDHLIIVGKVRRARFEPRRDPLLFFRGKYRRLHFL
jgi:flavin reductase (DIM6/NTAB) family NADH-FMN oxidoreductase RutF